MSATVTQEIFEKAYLPNLQLKGPVTYLNGRKHFNQNSQTVSIFERELVKKDHVFVLIAGKIYRFKVSQPELFRMKPTDSPQWKGPLNENTFMEVTQKWLMDTLGMPLPEQALIPAYEQPVEVAQVFPDPLTMTPLTATVIPNLTVTEPISSNEGFKHFIDNQLAKIRHTMVIKGAEYVRGDSRFSNFERTALMRNSTPEEALQGMLDKHLTNYFDMLEDLKLGKLHSEAQINERFGDIVVYFLIQHGQFLHRLNQTEVV